MQVSEWDLILQIGSEIAEIIRRGHLLPERVLHRDLRPSNVMLRGFYSGQQPWDVVVLDFDLSWHKGALEKSVTHGATVLGYLALSRYKIFQGSPPGILPWTPLALGWFLYFMLTGKDPFLISIYMVIGTTRLRTWQPDTHVFSGFSLPKRFSRLIRFATLHNQSERWDMTQIHTELQRLRDTVLNPSSLRSAELAPKN